MPTRAAAIEYFYSRVLKYSYEYIKKYSNSIKQKVSLYSIQLAFSRPY